ncbi:MAG: DUF4906 domain-containing protein [Bacteroidales bacterium]|nr:DUF4906 domain-containing protein [Bacteroidales bacterium]
MKKFLSTIFIVFPILSACSREKIQVLPSPGDWKTFPIEIESENGGFNRTRSSFPTDCLDMISDLNVAVYNNGRLCYSEYFTDLNTLALRFPDEDLEYDLFFLANSGKIKAPASEQAMEEFSCRYPDYSVLHSTGFPMSLTCRNFQPGSITKFLLKRLMGEYVLSFSNGARLADYEIQSVKLCNCAADIEPFADESKATEVFNDGDYLTESDIADLNNGKQVSLYFLENMQGVLLPGNTDPKKKIPSSISDSSVSGLCSYLLVEANAVTPTAEYDRILCRCYLGGDTVSDFNIKRNTRYELNLDFESDFIKEEEWRFEPDTPDITGNIRTSKSAISLFYGYDKLDGDIDVSVPEGAEYTVTLNGKENFKAGVSFTTDAPYRAGERAQIFTGSGNFHFKTSLKPDACLLADGTPDIRRVTATIATTDGLLTKKIDINVYHELFPIRLEYNNDQLKMKVFNPFARKFSTTVSGTVHGAGISQKSQIAGEKRENCSENLAVVSKTFIPASGQYVNIDNAAFHDACHKIRFNHDCWYDYTFFGTSGEWRHSFPNAYRVEVDISVDNKTLNLLDPIGNGEMFWLDNLPNLTKDEPDDRTYVVLWWPGYVWGRAKAWDADIVAKVAELKNDDNYMICTNDYNIQENRYTRVLPSGLDVKFHFIDESGNYWDFHSENTDDLYEYFFIIGRGNQNYNRTLELSVNGCCDWFWNFRGHKGNEW